MKRAIVALAALALACVSPAALAQSISTPANAGVSVIAKSGTAVSVTGTTTETTLATITIPANTLGPNGQIEIWTLWSNTNNANTKTPRIRFGGQSIANQPVTATNSLQMYARLANRGLTNSQVAQPLGFSGLGANAAVVTTAIDTTQDVALTINGTLGVSSDTLTLESYVVIVITN